MLRAQEHHVLEQVGKPGLAGLLVLRADVVVDIDRDHGRLVVLMEQDVQAVGQRVTLDLQGRDLEPPRIVATGRDSPGQEPAPEHQPDEPVRPLRHECNPSSRGSRAALREPPSHRSVLAEGLIYGKTGASSPISGEIAYPERILRAVPST